MIKMQIVMDDDKIVRDGKYNPNKLHASLDDFMVKKLGFQKGNEGFYYGSGNHNDYSHFGVAMTTLGKNNGLWIMFKRGCTSIATILPTQKTSILKISRSFANSAIR